MSKAASDTLEKVSSEFEGEVAADLEAGREEASVTIEAARRATAEAVAKIIETGDKQSESVRRQIVGAAELEARNAQLRSLERAVSEAFDSAMQEISKSSGAAYEKALARLIQEGLEVIGPKVVLQSTAKDRRAVTAAARRLGGKAKISLNEKPIEATGGVVLTTPDGSVRFDNTFEARLERMKASLRRDAAAVLTA